MPDKIFKKKKLQDTGVKLQTTVDFLSVAYILSELLLSLR